MRDGTHSIQSISNEARGRTLNHVRGTICVCGQNKGKGHAFCTQCTNKLSPDLRRDLRYMLTDTFVQAHHNAEEYLHRQREQHMWKDEGVFNLENINNVWNRWGMAFLSGAAIIGATIYATHLTQRRDRTEWTERERQTA